MLRQPANIRWHKHGINIGKIMNPLVICFFFQWLFLKIDFEEMINVKENKKAKKSMAMS